MLGCLNVDRGGRVVHHAKFVQKPGWNPGVF